MATCRLNVLRPRSGLSPPTRGSRTSHWRCGCSFDPGSIPAHAGEPSTARETATGLPLGGLSPPTRGSRDRRLGKLDGPGSIPAQHPTKRRPVYPRPRGGARGCYIAERA